MHRWYEMLSVIREFSENTDLPLIVKPNAGMPGNIESPESFAKILVSIFRLNREPVTYPYVFFVSTIIPLFYTENLYLIYE